MKARTATQYKVRPQASYPAGWFTEAIRAHNWPPRFEPRLQRTREVAQSELSRINREARQALGDTGTICGLTRRSDEMIAQRLISQRARL